MRVFLLAMCLAAVPALAQVYKWVDKDGRTHYGEKPPEGVKSAPVNVPPPGPATTPGDKPEDWKLKEAEFRKRQIDKQGAERAKEASSGPRPSPAACDRARRNLGVLREQVPVFKRNDKGERVYLEDTDRPARIADAERDVATYCKGL